MSGCVEHEQLEVPDTPDRFTMPSAACLRWAVGAKRSGSVRFQEKREKGNISIEQEETKSGKSCLVSSVPDSPDRLPLQNGGSLSRAVGGKRPRSVFKERRENEISSSREQERTKWGMATLVSSSDSPCFLGMTSRGRQSRLSKKDAFAQDQDHPHPGSPLMESYNKTSAEDKKQLKNDELCHSTQEEVKRNMEESISGHAILTPKWKRRKMLVRNGRISPNDATSDANISNRGVKRLQVAGDNLKGRFMNDVSAEANSLVDGKHALHPSGHCLRKMLVRNGCISPIDANMSNRDVKRLQVAGDNLKGSVMNDVSADANSLVDGKHALQPSGNCLPCSDQLDDRRKGKEIVTGDMDEGGLENSVQLTQSRKRMKRNLSSSEEAIRLPRWPKSTTHRCHGSSMVTEARSQQPRNGFQLNRSRDNESEENIQLVCGRLPHSRIHQHECQSSRVDKSSSRSSPVSLVVDEDNSSDTGTPEVIFLRSRQLRQNIPSNSITCNAQASSSDAVEVSTYSPIDVDSLETPLKNIVNIDASNKVSDARMRQIEHDEILARQLQEELAGEILEERLQEDDPNLHSTLQRERREHMSASDSGSIFPGLRASFGIGARREPARSLRIHPARQSALSSLRSLHSTIISGSGLMGRSRGRSVHDRAFRFPRNMNLEMRVDLLEAMEQIAESSDLTHQLISGVQRDFNEDDYEMLLALDNNNDNHRGASQQLIERLPTSTVQTEVADEQCSICLENPEVGDVIRHLLCMHKFHKGCIDPWLEIQACCPVCKHSI